MLIFKLLDSMFCCVFSILVRYTFRIISMKRLTGCVINISDCHVLFIRTVSNRYFNVLIAKFNGTASYLIIIRRVTGDSRCCHVLKRLTCSRCPSDLASNVILDAACSRRPSDLASNAILDAAFSKAGRLLAVAWCLWAVIHDIVNSHINIIAATIAVFNMIINNDGGIQTWNNLRLRTCPVASPIRIISTIL